MSAELQRFQREIVEVCEFYVDDDNNAKANVLYKKNLDGTITFNNPSKYIRQTLGAQGIMIEDNLFVDKDQNIEDSDSKVESKSDSLDKALNQTETKESVSSIAATNSANTANNNVVNQNVQSATNSNLVNQNNQAQTLNQVAASLNQNQMLNQNVNSNMINQNQVKTNTNSTFNFDDDNSVDAL